MRKYLLALGVLALFLLPTQSFAACAGGACFWIGGTGTLNLSSDSAHWSTSSGGTTCSCEPGTTDSLTFDGSSGGGTVTVNITSPPLTAGSISCGAFTGTLDFSANNNNVTLSGTNAFNCSGTGTRTLNLGNGTWSITNTSNNATVWSINTTTGLTFHANSSTITFANGSAGNLRAFQGGNSLVYNTVNFGSGVWSMNASSQTYTTLGLTAPIVFPFAAGTTTTVTNWSGGGFTGSSGSYISIASTGYVNGQATVSSANSATFTWAALQFLTFTGGGTFTATNSFDLQGNSGVTITAPSAGGGGSNIIGGGL